MCTSPAWGPASWPWVGPRLEGRDGWAAPCKGSPQSPRTSPGSRSLFPLPRPSQRHFTPAMNETSHGNREGTRQPARRTCSVARPGTTSPQQGPRSPPGTAANRAKAFGPATSQRASCCGPGPGSAARRRLKTPPAPGQGRAGRAKPTLPGPGRTAQGGRLGPRRLTCLMYMFARDGGGARPGASCRRSARPHRLFPTRMLGVTPGPPPPPPAPSASPNSPAQRPAHPSRKQNGGGASHNPTRREPFSTRRRGR